MGLLEPRQLIQFSNVVHGYGLVFRPTSGQPFHALDDAVEVIGIPGKGARERVEVSNRAAKRLGIIGDNPPNETKDVTGSMTDVLACKAISRESAGVASGTDE